MNAIGDPLSGGASPSTGEDPGGSGSGAPVRVIWHDLECGSYHVDLPLWQKLAATVEGPVLDIGAGTGRVTLDLARAARQVTALDIDSALLDALRERAAGLKVATVCADARTFELPDRDFGLCIVPMQTIQLLSGPAERAAFLHRALAHLRPGGLLACAIVTELEPFDLAPGSPGPSSETIRIGETRYISQAIGVRLLSQGVAIERERQIVSSSTRQSEDTGPVRAVASEHNIIELALLGASELEREGSRAGFHPENAVEIAPTDEHVGSTVVVLRA